MILCYTLPVKSNDLKCWTCESAKLKNTTCVDGICSISGIDECNLKICDKNCTNYCYSSLSKDKVVSGCAFLQVSLKNWVVNMMKKVRKHKGYLKIKTTYMNSFQHKHFLKLVVNF